MERKRSSQSTGTPSISERSPLIPSHGDDTVNIGIGLQTQEPETPGPSGGTQQPSFSFRSLSTDKKCTLVTMAFANFTACTCFSLLAPFFPREVSTLIFITPPPPNPTNHLPVCNNLNKEDVYWNHCGYLRRRGWVGGGMLWAVIKYKRNRASYDLRCLLQIYCHLSCSMKKQQLVT